MPQEGTSFWVAIDPRRAAAGAARFAASVTGMSGAATRLDRDIGRLSRTFTGFGAQLAAFIGIRAAARELLSFERGLIGVQKTTDLTGDQLDAFGRRMVRLSIDLGTPRAELLEFAEAAGQLGVRGAANLEAFANALSLLSQATGGRVSGGDAARSLARILRLTGESDDRVLNLASTIALLGDTLATTENEIISMSERVAQGTTRFDISTSAVVALSAAMSEAGVRSELGGTAVIRIFQKMTDAIISGGEELENFVGVLGISSDEFVRTFQQDAFAGFVLFLEGLREVGTDSIAASRALSDLGITQSRLNQVLGPLIKNYDRFGAIVKASGNEFENPNRLIEEFDKRARSLGFQLQSLGQTIGSVFAIEPGRLAGIADGVRILNEAVQVLIGLKDVSDDTESEVVALAAGLEFGTAVAGTVAIARLTGALVGMTGVLRTLGLVITRAAGPLGLAAGAFVLFGDEIEDFLSGVRASIFGVEGLETGFSRLTEEIRGAESALRSARAAGDFHQEREALTAQRDAILELYDEIIRRQADALGRGGLAQTFDIEEIRRLTGNRFELGDIEGLGTGPKVDFTRGFGGLFRLGAPDRATGPQALDAVQQALAKIESEIGSLEEAERLLTGTVRGQAEVFEESTSAIEARERALREAEDAAREVESRERELAATGVRAFEDLAFATDDWRDSLRSAAEELSRILASQLFLRPFATAAVGAVGGIFGGGTPASDVPADATPSFGGQGFPGISQPIALGATLAPSPPSTTVVVNQNIQTPDIGSFRRSSRQIANAAQGAFS